MGVLLGLGVLYFIPAFVADRRRAHNRLAILVLNLVAGWTAISSAWTCCFLVWACTAVRKAATAWPPFPGRTPPERLPFSITGLREDDTIRNTVKAQFERSPRR